MSLAVLIKTRSHDGSDTQSKLSRETSNTTNLVRESYPFLRESSDTLNHTSHESSVHVWLGPNGSKSVNVSLQERTYNLAYIPGSHEARPQARLNK